MVNQIINEGKMDEALNKLGKSFTERERWEINSAAIYPFFVGLKKNLNDRPIPYRSSDYEPDRTKLTSTLAINKVRGGEVETGFSKKGKLAYIGRFLNDGWEVRNKHGGPYTTVPPEQFWERTEADFGESVKVAELRALRKVMRERGLPTNGD